MRLSHEAGKGQGEEEDGCHGDVGELEPYVEEQHGVGNKHEEGGEGERGEPVAVAPRHVGYDVEREHDAGTHRGRCHACDEDVRPEDEHLQHAAQQPAATAIAEGLEEEGDEVGHDAHMQARDAEQMHNTAGGVLLSLFGIGEVALSEEEGAGCGAVVRREPLVVQPLGEELLPSLCRGGEQAPMPYDGVGVAPHSSYIQNLLMAQMLGVIGRRRLRLPHEEPRLNDVAGFERGGGAVGQQEKHEPAARLVP